MDIKYDVFISYSRHDYVDEHENVIPNNEVSKIMRALTDAGITYWIDKDGIYSGDKFTEELPRIIKSVPIFVYLSSANSNTSRFTSKEIAIADEYGKYIIPVRLDMTPYSDKIVFRIADISFIKYAVNPAKGREDLVKSIKAFLRKKEENKLQKEKAEAEEKRRQEEIERIETEISVLESQKLEREKLVLQKEQELKLAKVDLKACEVKIQRFIEKLEKIRDKKRLSISRESDKEQVPIPDNSSFVNHISPPQESKSTRTQIAEQEWHQLVRFCMRNGNRRTIWRDSIVDEVLDIKMIINNLKRMGVAVNEKEIYKCITVDSLKKILVKNT